MRKNKKLEKFLKEMEIRNINLADLLKCEVCKKDFIKEGYSYRPDCEHYPKNIRISVG